jgi:hypothetical protein
MIRGRLAIAFALAALVVVAVGCGGGGSDNSDNSTSSDEAKSLTSKEFVEKADSICTQSQEKINKKYSEFVKELKGKETQDQTLEAIETIGIPQVRLQLEALRELEAPASKEAEMTAYLDALEEEVEAGEKDPKALNGSATEVFAKSEAAAKGLGFKVCANKNA